MHENMLARLKTVTITFYRVKSIKFKYKLLNVFIGH